MHKQTRWERKIVWERKFARDASLRPKGKVYQTHCHVCTCTKLWLCKLDHGLPKSGKDVLCVQCAEKKRAIEAELNSGQQMQINFEPEYAQYSDFMTFGYKAFIQNLSSPSVFYATSYKNPITEAQIKEAMDKIAKSPYPGKLSEPGTGVNSGNDLEVIDILKPYVKYDIKYSVQYMNSKDEIVSGAYPSLGKSALQDPVKMTSKVPFYDEMSGDPLYPIPVDSPKPIEVKGLAKKNLKYIPADKSVI